MTHMPYAVLCGVGIMNPVPASTKVWLACAATGMRKGVDGPFSFDRDRTCIRSLFKPLVCVSGSSGRSDQGDLVGWLGVESR